jgi:hypothetical protein
MVKADDLEPPFPFYHCVYGKICLDLRLVDYVARFVTTYNVTSVDNCTDLSRAVHAAPELLETVV